MSSNFNPDVPILWVKLTLDQGDDDGVNRKGSPIELTTSITSSFVNDSCNHKSWNYRAFHRLPP